MIKKQLIPVIVILLVFCTAGVAQIRNAEFEVHNRGMLWETMKDNGTIGAPDPLDQFAFYPSMDWPGGPDELLLKDEQRSYMAGAGLWMGGMLNGSVFFTENGPFQLVDDGTFEGIEKIENYLENPGYNPNEEHALVVGVDAVDPRGAAGGLVLGDPGVAVGAQAGQRPLRELREAVPQGVGGDEIEDRVAEELEALVARPAVLRVLVAPRRVGQRRPQQRPPLEAVAEAELEGLEGGDRRVDRRVAAAIREVLEDRRQPDHPRASVDARIQPPASTWSPT